MSALDEAAANAAAKKQSMSFAERMAARDKARKAKWAKARAEKTVDAEEDPAVFWQKFGGESAKVAKRAENATTESEVKQLEKEAATLRSKVSDAAAYLTQYDIKRATAEADQATKAVKEAKERICPREKYAFAEGTVHVEKGVEKIKFADRQKEMSKVSVGGEIPGFRNEQGKVLVVDETWSTQVHLEDLKDCVVFAPYPLQTLRLVRLENCHVYSKSIAGPCYVHNCVGCVFRVVPRQLRIHDPDWATHPFTSSVALPTPPPFQTPMMAQHSPPQRQLSAGEGSSRPPATICRISLTNGAGRVLLLRDVARGLRIECVSYDSAERPLWLLACAVAIRCCLK